MDWTEPESNSSFAPIPGLHPLVSQALIRRGITQPEAITAFLKPEAYSPTPASDLPNLPEAIKHIEKAIRLRKPICVWGDFDVDGQTATTILYSTLLDLGANVTYHIPVRAQESHGINIPVLTEIIHRGAKLILTCDTGITAYEAVAFARSRGVEIIITDHHDLPHAEQGKDTGTLPQATTVVNPKFLPEGHPLSTLSGSGVAYKVAEELFLHVGQAEDAKRHLDLAALGLVGDLAVLTGDTRYLVQRGLEALRNTRRLGLYTMMELAELSPANLNEEHIGFVLGPRLNAIGRLDDANPVVDLLTTSDPARARLLATQLEGLNARRQLLCNQVTQAAEAQLRNDPSLMAQPVLVLGHPDWPGGVVGIAASRLAERYGKPAILFSAPVNEVARGSARSIEGLNITTAIAAQRDLINNFGGHPMAAGLSIEPEKIPEFRRRLAKTVEKMTVVVKARPALQIDGWIGLPAANLEIAENLEQLAPFGPGNSKLILAASGLKLISAVKIGRNDDHIKLTVADEYDNSQSVLWWNGSDEPQTGGVASLEAGNRFDLAFTIRPSNWRGTRQAQLEFVDFRLSKETSIEIHEPVIKIQDYRDINNPGDRLNQLIIEKHSIENESMVIWAEGDVNKIPGCRGRNKLEHAETLVIWTAPPGPEELHLALKVVKPNKVILFAIDPGFDELSAFLKRLAGLVKYVIKQRDGRTSIVELASATAQRQVTVHKGLEWLVKQGQVQVLEDTMESLVLEEGSATVDKTAVAHLAQEIRSLLAESAAYRKYFRHGSDIF